MINMLQHLIQLQLARACVIRRMLSEDSTLSLNHEESLTWIHKFK